MSSDKLCATKNENFHGFNLHLTGGTRSIEIDLFKINCETVGNGFDVCDLASNLALVRCQGGRDIADGLDPRFSGLILCEMRSGDDA